MTATLSQTEAVLAWLNRYGSITPLEALNELGCMRLAARIAELRAEGNVIATVPVQVGGKRWARYIMARDVVPEGEQRMMWGDR